MAKGLQILVFWLAAAILGPAGAGAQTIRGVLLNETTGFPVSRAYLVLLNQDSVEVARGLANTLGEFTVVAPAAGVYRIRTERIGYRSIVSDSFEMVFGEPHELELRIPEVSIRLDPYRIEGSEECRVIGDQALEVLTVWEEARKALAAVAWTGQQELLIHELEQFQRWYDLGFIMVHEIRDTVPTHHVMPFRSRPVEELEEHGYVRIEEDTVRYEAPDAEVFFSAPFLQNHCFRLDEREERGRRQLGLQFEPVAGRENADVSGTFWLDAMTGALDKLEMRYVNVGVWLRERQAAGELEFDRLPDGRWFVSRWWVRMPVVRRVDAMKGPIWHFPEAIVGFKQDGGDVFRVSDVDGQILYARGRATVTGSVFDSTTGSGLGGALVRLSGTRQATVSEPDGSFWLADLPEGRYTVTFSHPLLDLVGWSDIPGSEQIRLRENTVAAVTLASPSPETIVDRLCGMSVEEGVGLLVGRVVDVERDTIVTGGQVKLVWIDESTDSPTPRQLEAETDSLGVYRACVPRHAPLSVEVSVNSRMITAVPTTFGDKILHILDLAVRPSGGSSAVGMKLEETVFP